MEPRGRNRSQSFWPATVGRRLEQGETFAIAKCDFGYSLKFGALGVAKCQEADSGKQYK